MKATVIALSASLLVLGACAHAPSAGPAAEPKFEVTNPIRLALQPISVPPELKDSGAPAAFEQTLCTSLFELNKKQVMCSDEVKVFIENKRQSMVLGSDDGQLDAVLAALDAPRRVNLVAAQAGKTLSITVIVQEKSGKTLERFQVPVAADGADVMERSREAALRIVQIK